ncbi:hypothetical protein F5Y19DRAFT_258891 [Xylariaceae sp. FL1651]|nr:hypothetical protein F5Y19DRAFT_258891 [Xylariaceae sp. FL1651]
MSSSDDPRIKFGLSCPNGGDFYICADAPTQFIGCCGVDPCATGRDGACPPAQLFDASFSAARGVTLVAAQSCAAPWNASVWYTCTNARPPFLGCCANNPCNNGCLAGHLIPAVLSGDPKNASEFLVPITTATTMSSSGTETKTASASPTASGDGGDGGDGGRPKSQTGLIVGITLAGVVVLLLVLGIYLWLKRREEARELREREQILSDNQVQGAARASQGFIEGARSKTSPTTGLSPPADKGGFPADNSQRASQDPRAYASGPRSPNYYHSPHLSQLSELDGSEITRASHPNSTTAYRGF